MSDTKLPKRITEPRIAALEARVADLEKKVAELLKALLPSGKK